MPRQGKVCLVNGCPSRSKKQPDKRFYPFAKPWMNREKCMRWIAFTRKKDLLPEHINKECYVCGDHFVGNGPTSDSPDPSVFKVTDNVLEVLAKSPHLGAGQSPARQAALRIRNKAISPKKRYQMTKSPYALPLSRSVGAGSEDTQAQSPVLCEGLEHQRNTLSLSAQPNSISFSPDEPLPDGICNVIITVESTEGENPSLSSEMAGSSDACTADSSAVYSSMMEDEGDAPLSSNVHSTFTEESQTRALSRKLFEDFMADIDDITCVGEGGIHPLGDSPPELIREDNVVRYAPPEKVGMRSVDTQTISRWTLSRLIACGQLYKRSTTSNGVQVMWINDDRDVSLPSEPDAEYRSEHESEPEPELQPEPESAQESVRNKSGKKNKSKRAYFSYESLSLDEEDFEYLCGLCTETFDLLYEFLGGDNVCSLLKYEAESGTPRILRNFTLSLKTRLFMTLCRLRRGFTEKELAIMFRCSVSLISRVLNTWINFMYLEFKELEECMFQDRKSQKKGMPKRFQSFNGLRVIIDCTEIGVETPSNFQQQGNTWSSYKHKNTVKYLIGINVHGAICYVSEAFEGSMSDKEVFMRSSMYHMLQPGDVVMADRGFDVSEELDLIKVKLVIPSYLKGRDYLSAEEEIWSKKIARARIFVENAIGRVKMWRILDSTFPQSTLPLVSQMFFVCACLTNFQVPLL